jgi:acyl-CoA synthetase (AMP-forming)/AMP-acid ligase II
VTAQRPSHETLGGLLAAAAGRAPLQVALITPSGETITYSQLESWSNRWARGLSASGLHKGDRVVTVIGERAEYVVLAAAALKAGLVVVPVSWRFRPSEAAGIAADVAPAAVIYEPAYAETAEGALAASDPRPLALELGGEVAIEGARSLDELARNESDASFDEAAADDLAYIAYTSGTTGSPKGAVFDHRACRLAAGAACLSYGLPQFGTGIQSGSLSYVPVSIVHIWAHIYSNGTSVLLGRFDAERLVSLLEQHQGTFTYLPTPSVPEIIELLATHPSALKRLRCALVGASPIVPSTLETLVSVAGDSVIESYGMTETVGTPVCIGRRSDWIEDDPPFTCVGRAVPPAVIGLLDEDGAFAPHDGVSVGQIVVESPCMMRGYWGDPAVTAAATDDGWLLTGDQAAITPDGRVLLKGRSKEVIISGGANVYPIEVEAVLATSSLVKECAVIGVPDTRWGETPVAFVVAQTRGDTVQEQLRDLCRSQLAAYKCPRRFVFVDELPRNSTGKILKRLLVEDIIAEASA